MTWISKHLPVPTRNPGAAGSRAGLRLHTSSLLGPRLEVRAFKDNQNALGPGGVVFGNHCVFLAPWAWLRQRVCVHHSLQGEAGRQQSRCLLMFQGIKHLELGQLAQGHAAN